ncbi:MAG: RNA polymerase sigma factor [Deltaproteobacteria bacterium]|nr:MAG: RNA polymerase sigma factor [Deltaproteobacteria bacterium]
MASECEFIKIYNEYYQKVIRYLVRIVGANDAEDIAQEVFDKISQSLGGFRGNSKLSTWIYRIATNTAIDRLRSAGYKHSTQHSTFEEATDLDGRNGLASHDHPATDQALIRKEMSECVREFIGNLSPDYRTIIALSELEELTNKEIADILDISIENVKIRLHRARAKLKESLNDGCDFYHNEQNVLFCDRKQSQILPKIPK